MRGAALILFLVISSASIHSQAVPSAKPATVPITLDHNRIIIDVYLPLPDGGSKRVRAWVDTANSQLLVTRNAVSAMAPRPASAAPSSSDNNSLPAGDLKSITIGGLEVPLAGAGSARVIDADAIAPGLSAAINLPASVLRNFDVLIDYPDREFTIAPPGALRFHGQPAKITVDAATGRVLVPGKLDGKKYDFVLDLASSVTLLSSDLFQKLQKSHPEWPRMTGAVGIANQWGDEHEVRQSVMRVGNLQCGPLFLTDVVVAERDSARDDSSSTAAVPAAAGWLGANSLLNYRIGLDYRKSTVFFELGTTFKAPDMDVVGLTLRPSAGGAYTISGIANFQGAPAVPEIRAGDVLISVNSIRAGEGTLGQVWSSLEGNPGQVRTLTVERAGRRIQVAATVRRFLAATSAMRAPAPQR